MALAGCTTSSDGQAATIHVSTTPSKWTAEFAIAHAGIYSYDLTFAPHCVPIFSFAFISPEKVESYVRGPSIYAASPKPIPAHETGTVRLTNGKWTGIDGNGDPNGPQPSIPAPSLPLASYWHAGCSWSLVLTSTS
jgi:hypothetical protein